MAKFDPDKDHGVLAGPFPEYPNARYVQNGVYFTASGEEAKPEESEKVEAVKNDFAEEDAKLEAERAKDEARKARERDRKRKARAAARAKKARAEGGSAAAA